MTLVMPSEVAPTRRSAGGDNSVERDALDRPRITVTCAKCSGSGQIPSTKVAGRLNKCQTCKGEGVVKRSYTRTTTFIDVLSDQTKIAAWKMRLVLIGASRDPGLLEDVPELDMLSASDDEAIAKEAKDKLDRLAQVAKTVAGGDDKANKGTELHGLSEMVDEGKLLPAAIEFNDVVDIDAYKRGTRDFKIIHMEKLVVHDELKVGGTPDRISSWVGDKALVAPDGSVIGRDESIITDLKTGRTDLGGLKMAMQLALYSRSQLYVPGQVERVSLGNINRRWGVIINVPAGSGVCTLHWADLTLGWEAVLLAKEIRSMRSREKKALTEFVTEASPFAA